MYVENLSYDMDISANRSLHNHNNDDSKSVIVYLKTRKVSSAYRGIMSVSARKHYLEAQKQVVELVTD